MSKVKSTSRGKSGKRHEPWESRALKIELFRKVVTSNRTDIFLLERLRSNKESSEPVGPLAGKASA